MMEIFGPNFAYGYLLVGVIIGFVVGRITAPKGSARDVGGGRSPGSLASGPARPVAAGSVNLEIGGQKIDIDPGAMVEIQRLAAEGKKIEAIKHLREVTGLGLAEAKQMVEAIEQMRR